MMELIAKGGVLVMPIAACSVVACAIFCERLVRFAFLYRRGHGLEERVSALIKDRKDPVALEMAAQSRCPMGRILVQAIEVDPGDRDTLETVIAHAVEKEVRYLSRYLQLLATIGNIAPLLGLLGTVVGMIKAFMVIEQMDGKVNAAILAGGIWEAMLTTALGLSVALPTLLAHSFLTARLGNYQARLESGCVTFLKTLAERRQKLSH